VTNQRVGGEPATEGWLVGSRLNRVCFFDGGLLHGTHLCLNDVGPVSLAVSTSPFLTLLA
jgi:hypothetical protein